MCPIEKLGLEYFKPSFGDNLETTKAINPGYIGVPNIPVGFVFDGASIPPLFWRIIGKPKDPKFRYASCVHDWFCVHAALRHDYQLRVIGDAIFFDLLKKAGVKRWRRRAMYVAVRLHGFLALSD